MINGASVLFGLTVTQTKSRLCTAIVQSVRIPLFVSLVRWAPPNSSGWDCKPIMIKKMAPGGAIVLNTY